MRTDGEFSWSERSSVLLSPASVSIATSGVAVELPVASPFSGRWASRRTGGVSVHGTDLRRPVSSSRLSALFLHYY